MVLDAIKRRRSIRKYASKAVPEALLNELIEAARLAPSARNRQPWKFVFVQNSDLRSQLMEASMNQHFVGEAPVIIAACATQTGRVMTNGVPSYPVDLSIALDHIALQAVELGLGTCWIGAFEQEKIKTILHIPDHVTVVCLMTLGYPEEIPSPTGRKSFQEIVCYNEYS